MSWLATWQRWTPRERDRAVVAGLALAAIFVQAPLWDWIVEDAAISFAFAHHLADGHGLVAYPGGERVEGYSNPLWVLLLACWEVFGVPSATAARLMTSAFAAVAVALVFRGGRLVRSGDATPRLAALALVLNAQFAIWNASGLENALFHVLLAAGIWRIVADARGGPPWSALCFLGLALTRPEGVVYAAVAGIAAAGFAWREGRGLRPAVVWLAAFALPFATYHGLRFAYFAWEWPNPYYAKLSHRSDSWLDGSSPGWQYLRAWAGASTTAAGPGLAQLFFLPLYGMGFRGASARERLVLALCGALALVPAGFAVLAGGDWMAGYRWLSFAAVPSSLLLGAGIAALADGGRPATAIRPWLAAALVLLFAVPHVRHFVWFGWNRPVSVYRVERRADYWDDIRRALDLDRFTLLDSDMGAMMLHSGAEIVDLGGLVDVPIARHGFADRFLNEYLFEERRPELAHVHGRWAKGSAILDLRPWRAQYLEIPGYLSAKEVVHGGGFVRRDLLFAPRFRSDPGQLVSFENGSTLGFRLPALPSGPGANVFVELGLHWNARDADAEDPPMIHVFLSQDTRALARARFTPAHGWLRPSEWPPDSAVKGFVRLPVPDDLLPGRYDLGFVLADERGRVVRGRPSPGSNAVIGGRADVLALMAPGEARFPKVVEILSKASYEEFDAAEGRLAVAHAEAGDCDAAHETFERVRRRASPKAARQLRRTSRPALAACLAAAAAGEEDRARAIDSIAHARRLDPDAPGLDEAAAPLADALYAEGLAARDRARALPQRDGEKRALLESELAAWQEAYRAFSDALRADPTRSFARRYAEEARAERLGLEPTSAATLLAAEDGRAGP